MKSGHYLIVSWVNEGGKPLHTFVLHLLGVKPAAIHLVVAGIAEVAGQIAVTDGHSRTSLVGAPPGDMLTHRIQDYLWADDTLCRPRLARHLTEFVNGRQLRRVPLTPGGPIEGWEIFGREHVRERAEHDLGEVSLHLMAPRRYGKTSVLTLLRASLPRTLHLDLSEIDSLPGFCVHIASEAMEQEVLDGSHGIVQMRGWPPAGSSVLARQHAREELRRHVDSDCVGFLESLLTALADREVVVLLDEFSLLLRKVVERNERNLQRSLAVARQLRTRAKRPLRWIIAGSAGLRLFIQFKGLVDVFDDLRPLPLGPLSRGDAEVLVEELFFGQDLRPTQEVVAAVLEHVGMPIPYFLQILVHHTVSEARAKRLDPALVRMAYERRVLGSDGSIWFRSFQLSAHGYPAHLRQAGAAILRRLARSVEPVPDAELRALFEQHRNEAPDNDYQLLLSCLSEDYDLELKDHATHMRSKVLRERWSLGEPWLTGAR